MKQCDRNRTTTCSARVISCWMMVLLAWLPAAEADNSALRPVLLVPNAGQEKQALLVTMGVPLAPCQSTDATDFRLLDEHGEEVAVFVKPTLSWHFRSACPSAIRALKVQFRLDPRSGARTYQWDLSGRDTARDPAEQPVAKLATRAANKAGVSEPAVFAIHPAEYLTGTGLIPPTSPAGSSPYDEHYLPSKWEYDSRDFDYSKSRAANWLFDRVSTNYRQAIRRAELEHYREAYRSHQWWQSKINVESGSRRSCLGGFKVDGKASKRCDGKYIYAEPHKLHLALTGDDSWQPTDNGDTSLSTRELLIETANTVWSGGVPVHGFSRPYRKLGVFYTERSTGFGLQTLLNVCELTADPQVCRRVDQAVDNLYQHHRKNPDGFGAVGYQAHSWAWHEGTEPYLGRVESATDRQLVLAELLSEQPGIVAGSVLLADKQKYQVVAVQPGTTGQLVLTLADGGLPPVSAIVSLQAGTSPNGYRVEADRVFSPWMQAVLADGLWQYYWHTDQPGQRLKAKTMLVNFAESYAAYAIDGTRLSAATRAAIEAAFSVTIFDTKLVDITDCGLNRAPVPRYVANRLMASAGMNETYAKYLLGNGGYADQHIPEGLFQLAVGIHLSENPVKRDAMRRLAADMLEWFERYECTSGNRNKGRAIPDPPRAWSWQNRADPFGTYCWALGAADTVGGGDVCQ